MRNPQDKDTFSKRTIFATAGFCIILSSPPFAIICWAICIIAGLFILGPERLPEAAAWLGRNLRKVRDYATGARQQLHDELGPEFDELRKPLEDLRSLRGMDPKRAVT